MGAKEFLLAQSGEWPKMLHDGQSVEYVKKRFRESIIAFTTVFDSLGSNTVSTEWLTNLERCHTLFPWMNYRIFSRKK
jgi:1,4-alpha-glucan branching enzyme